jgi:PKD repeat protein
MRRALAVLLCLSMVSPTLPAPIALAAGGKPKPRVTATARIVALARRELNLGVREVPDGSNRAPAIRRYETATRGAMFGAPWCAYFVSYVARRAGVPIGAGGAGLGYVPYIRSWAKQSKRWKRTPRAGDLITFPQHVGIVENVYANHTLTTIEGNAGNAVRRRWRRWGEAMGYVRVATGASAPAAAPTTTPKATPPVAKKKAAPATKLVARITAYPGTAAAPGQTLSFTSNDSGGDIVRSAWDFDGNGTYDASGDSVDKRFDKAGAYKVGLRVTDSAKHTATAALTVTIRSNRAPVAVLDVPSDRLTVGDKLTANAGRSSDPDGKIVRYEWDLDGNGEWGEDGKRHSITFDAPGDYSPGLRVIDDAGNVAETHVAVHVADKPGPASRITCDSATVLAGRAVRCRADDSGSPVAIADHSWDVDGDGGYDKRASEVRVSFRKAGERTLRMRATDGRGRSVEDSVTLTVTDNPPTAAVHGPATVGLGQAATFDATDSSDPDGTIVSYAWDLDDDGSFETTGAHPSVAYATPGRRTVRLRVTDDDGASASAVATITVTNQAPRAVIALPASRKVNADLAFDGSGSSDPDGSVALYEWDLDGDGSYETAGARPVARYTTTGKRTIRLRVTDAFGLTATATTSITIVY